MDELIATIALDSQLLHRNMLHLSPQKIKKHPLLHQLQQQLEFKSA